MSEILTRDEKFTYQQDCESYDCTVDVNLIEEDEHFIVGLTIPKVVVAFMSEDTQDKLHVDDNNKIFYWEYIDKTPTTRAILLELAGYEEGVKTHTARACRLAALITNLDWHWS